jgi:hypothetical protein
MTFFYKNKLIIGKKKVSFFKDKILKHNIHAFFSSSFFKTAEKKII